MEVAGTHELSSLELASTAWEIETYDSNKSAIF